VKADRNENHRQYWQAQAARVRRRVNLAWWLESLSAPMVVFSLAGAAALLWVRREFPQVVPEMLSSATMGGLALLAMVCWLRAFRRFENSAASLVRIESAMRLRNGLSAAEAGVATWPAPIRPVNDGLSWRWPRFVVPLLGSLAMLAAGLWFPVSTSQAAAVTPPEQPQSWTRLAAELEQLASEQWVDPSYLEEVRKRLEELQSQEVEDWFSHASLEATDALLQAHRAETGRLEQEIEKAARVLEHFGKNPPGALQQAARERLMEEFAQALQGFDAGAMKLNPELLEQLRQLDLKNLGGLTPEQLEALREGLREAADQLGECRGGPGEGEAWAEGEGQCEGGEEGQGDGPGRGGVQRGPGHVPGLLGEAGETVETGEAAALEALDLSQTAPGDLLEMQDGEHDVDRSASRLSAGGATDATGRGGDRVWREQLDPAEQRVLKRFFD
jgi:hypothetical protein